MAKKSPRKPINLRLEIVTKSPFAGSGPRGVDVYAAHLYGALTSIYSHNAIFLSRDKVGDQPVDVVHYTFFDPFFLTLWSLKHKSKYIVTVHDLIPLKFSDHFPLGIKGRIKWLLQKQALLGASAIITDSECSKADIASIVGYPVNKIFVVPLAAGHTTVNQAMVRTVKSTYNLPERYLLYVGDINWNKNVPGLIRAFGQLNSSKTHLVLVGKAFKSGGGTQEYIDIKAAISASGKSDFIHILGFVPSHHLPAIYRGATLYVQPSWYEGFGFPLLEAMEQGVPVLSANTGSLPEVGGEVVHYFDPSVNLALTSLLKDLLANKAKREQYVDKAKSWAQTFSWDRVVQGTSVVYEKVVS